MHRPTQQGKNIQYIYSTCGQNGEKTTTHLLLQYNGIFRMHSETALYTGPRLDPAVDRWSIRALQLEWTKTLECAAQRTVRVPFNEFMYISDQITATEAWIHQNEIPETTSKQPHLLCWCSHLNSTLTTYTIYPKTFTRFHLGPDCGCYYLFKACRPAVNVLFGIWLELKYFYMFLFGKGPCLSCAAGLHCSVQNL